MKTFIKVCSSLQEIVDMCVLVTIRTVMTQTAWVNPRLSITQSNWGEKMVP